MTKNSSDKGGGSSTPGEADELSGFDNIADRFRAQEAEERAEQAATSVVEKQTAAPTEGRFAPPEAAEPLALQLDGTTRRRSAPEIAVAVPPKSRAPSQWVTREETPSRGRSLVVLLGLALVAGGGFAGYRYATLGHVLPKDGTEPAHLQLTVEPTSAEMILNGKPFRGIASLEPDTEVSLALRAKGYLPMRARITPKAAQKFKPQIVMGHTVPMVGNGSASKLVYPEIGAALSPKDASAGYEKLAELTDCGVRLTQALANALPSSEDAEPEPVAYGLNDECGLVMQAAAAKEPSLEGLDAHSTRLVAVSRELTTGLRDAKASAAASVKEQKAIRAAVRKASAEARKVRGAWLEAMNAAYVRLLAEDAKNVPPQEAVHARLRSLILASDAFARGSGGKKKSVTALRERLATELAKASEGATQNAASYKAAGGDNVIALVQAVHDEPEQDAVIERHNAAAKAFNLLVLPIRLGAAN